MSLKVRVTLLVVLFLVLGVFTVTVVNVFTIRGKLLAYAEGEMVQKIEKEAVKLDNWLKERLITLQSIAPNLENLFLFFDTGMIDMSLRSYDENLQALGFMGQIIISADGKAFTLNLQSDRDLSKERFFQEALNGNVFVQDSVLFNNSRGLVFSVPVRSYSGEILGAYAAFLPQEKIDELILSVKHGESGYAFLTNADGIVVSHPDGSLIGRKLGEIDENLKILEEKITNKETGVVNYVFRSEKKVATIANVPSVGWSIVLTMPRKEVEMVFGQTILMNASVAAIVTVLATIVAILFGRSITMPIVRLANAARKIAEGDLEQTYEFKRVSGEIAELSKAFSILTTSLKDSIMSLKTMGERMDSLKEELQRNTESAKNASAEARSISEEATKIVNNVSQLLHQVDMGTREITSGSEQTSKSALLLSENSEKLRRSSKAVEQAVKKLIESVETLNRQQQIVRKSMEELANFTDRIEEVINTIYSIAEQTNLLALNAAIEAARAGEAGRGFAVVAEEIRKLAEQSRASTKKIGDFLVGIRSHAQLMLEQGEEITKTAEASKGTIDESLKTLESMIQDIEKVANMSNDLAAVSQEQNAAVEEINTAIERIVKEVDEVSSSVKKLSESVSDQSERIEALSRNLGEVIEVFEELTATFSKYRIG